jgi:membrane protein DedA with SNARE-associated domain
MNHEPSHRRVLLWTIIAALAVWGCLLGLGAYLGLDPQTPDRDFRRLWVVAATTGGFLLFWLLLLWRGPKKRK